MNFVVHPNTKAKIEIQNLISESKNALSQSEIQEKLEGFCDRVTVYRVLERLKNERVIHKVTNTDGIIKYAMCKSCTKNHNHVHFNCTKCKSLTYLEDVNPIFQLPEKYKIEEVNFTFSGLCPKCSN